MLEFEDVPDAARPDAHRRVRGLERRRRGGLARRRAPRGGLGRRGHRGARPGGLLRLPGQPPEGDARRRAAADRARPPHGSSSRATTGLGSRDVVLVEGIEPSTRWRAFTIELLEFAERLGVSTFVTLGALLADVPHTRPIPVTATSDDEDVLHRLDLESSTLRGPDRHRRRPLGRRHRAGLPSLSLLGRRPALRRRARRRPRPPSACSASWSRCSTCRSRSATCRRRPGPGSAASTSWPSPTTRSPSTSSPSRRPPTPPTCPRPAATRSPASSSATCAVAATRAPAGLSRSSR